jgi:hypothetical protein
LHERGINVRYLPFVRNSVPLHCTRERRWVPCPERCGFLRNPRLNSLVFVRLITTEMVCRFAKHALQWRMREVRSSDDRVLAGECLCFPVSLSLQPDMVVTVGFNSCDVVRR